MLGLCWVFEFFDVFLVNSFEQTVIQLQLHTTLTISQKNSLYQTLSTSGCASIFHFVIDFAPKCIGGVIECEVSALKGTSPG
jgi:hypothetical protein